MTKLKDPLLPERSCEEDPRHAEKRAIIQAFERRFWFYVLFSIIYGLIFVNYIDIMVVGSLTTGYHMWLVILYASPFLVLTIVYPKNWMLTVGLAILVSLMNDVFYGPMALVFGKMQLNLSWYFSRWFVPSGEMLFDANVGFAIVPVYSWMMAVSIYGRIIAAVLLLKTWKSQAKKRCLETMDKRRDWFARLKSPKSISKLIGPSFDKSSITVP